MCLEIKHATSFSDNYQDNMSFTKLTGVMNDEYDTDARQLAVKSELEKRTLQQVMSDDDLTDQATSLTKLMGRINTLTPHCRPNFRSDHNKISFFR